MSKKDFYSFYKLNDEEINKIKEEVSVPAPAVRKKSIPKGKITAAAVSVVMFVLGLVIGIKFMPDRNSGSNIIPVETAPAATEEITTKKTTTTKKTEAKKAKTTTAKTEPVTEKTTQKSKSVKTNNLVGDIDNWANWVYEDVGAEATFNCFDDGLNVHVKDTGLGDYYYYVMGKYANLELKKNTLYHIEFDYWSSDNVRFELIVQHDAEPYTYYYGDELYATPTRKHYSGYFLMTETDDNANIAFDCCNGSVSAPYNVFFRNISLSSCKLNDDFYRDSGDGYGYFDKNEKYHKYEENTEVKSDDANLLKNIGRYFYKNEEVGVSAEVEDTSNGFIIKVNDEGTSEHYTDAQVYYNDIKLSKNLYHIEFDYKTSEPMSFYFSVDSSNEQYKMYYSDNTLCTIYDNIIYDSIETKHYSAYFSLPKNDNVDINFACCSGLGKPYSVEIKNISLSRCE